MSIDIKIRFRDGIMTIGGAEIQLHIRDQNMANIAVNFLFRAHQNHYEQFGDVCGTVTIDGADHQLNMNCMRDHTHGSTRDWRLMRRYGIQNFRTQEGFRWGYSVATQKYVKLMVVMK